MFFLLYDQQPRRTHLPPVVYSLVNFSTQPKGQINVVKMKDLKKKRRKKQQPTCDGCTTNYFGNYCRKFDRFTLLNTESLSLDRSLHYIQKGPCNFKEEKTKQNILIDGVQVCQCQWSCFSWKKCEQLNQQLQIISNNNAMVNASIVQTQNVFNKPITIICNLVKQSTLVLVLVQNIT